jgi:release factor glutamine methyltransferase
MRRTRTSLRSIRHAQRWKWRNAQRHACGRISFVQGSLLGPLRARVDVVAANLPYIANDVYAALPPEIREHEPEQALRAGARGTELIEALLAEAPTLLAPGGLLVAEHAWDQGEALRSAAHAAFPGARIETKRDLAGERAGHTHVDVFGVRLRAVVEYCA